MTSTLTPIRALTVTLISTNNNIKTTTRVDACLYCSKRSNTKIKTTTVSSITKTEIKNKTKIKVKTKTKTSKYNYVLRAALRLRELKIQKSKTLLRGPKLLVFLVFLVFLGLFWFSNRNQTKTHGVFWFSNRNPKNHRVFLVFHQRPNKKTKKKPVFFWFST